ncbi:MAG: hypothetical protein DLM58_06975 [Pseudonocardiales bacterium]|nr:MAG: hypothetical protein DLM58_06975 [Pseudonocardiales bacterium]
MNAPTDLAGPVPDRSLRRKRMIGAAALLSTCLLLTVGCTSSSKGKGSNSPASTAPVTTQPASTASNSTPADTSPATSSAPASSSDDIAGDWTGTFANSTTGQTGTFAVTFSRQGETITGHITINGGGSGTINGTLSGNKITFGTITGSTTTFDGSFSGNSMSGTYKAGADNGTWMATR